MSNKPAVALGPDEVVERALALLDQQEPRIHAMMAEPGRRARLSRQADELATRAEGEHRPLFGVLVAVKDVFHVAGLPTTAGSRLPVDQLAGDEASCVGRLRRAGALVLGKSVSTEFAFYAPGPTRNPRHLGHTPGGSSSGSAAAVAAGYCPLALGTQTIGSITRPASFCGVVGYKPSYGRIASDGLIPLAPTFDHVGLLAATVGWARRGAVVLVEGWRGAVVADRRPVLAVPEGPYLGRASEAMGRHFQALLGKLAAVGYEIRRQPALGDIAAIETAHRTILAAEMAAVHAPWLPRYRPLYHPTTLTLIDQGQRIDGERLATARQSPPRLRQLLDTMMAEQGIDLWLSPSAPGPAPAGISSTGDPVMNRPWTHAGLPTLGIPSGDDPLSGLPLGLQLAARFGWDEELLAWGSELAAVVGGAGDERR